MDGLCCSDIHSVGALDEVDCEMLAAISEDAIERHPGADEPILMMRADTGTCVFFGQGGCELHRKLGPELKPSPCRRFPFGLTATPAGGRITTQHRCPCRTLGPRPAITIEMARPCLVDHDGDLQPDHAVQTVPWVAGHELPFDEYARREADMLEVFLEGKTFRQAIQREPFTALQGRSWSDVAQELSACEGPSRVDTAARWVGDAIAVLVERGHRSERDRPWADAFEHARKRVRGPEHPNVIFGDWLADELWGLRWTHWGSLARARTDWATRLAIARKTTAWLIEEGFRDDVAAAEAVMIADVVGHSEPWERLQAQIPDR